MTAATVSVPSASVQAKAAILLHERAGWRYYRHDGVRYIAMPSGEHVYAVRYDGRGCSCDCYRKSLGRVLCSHRLSAIEAANHDALSTWITEIAAHSTAASADGWSPIPADEQASHAAFRARLAAEPTPKARRGYADLFGPDEFDDVLTSAF